jgi:hypothetical protein
MNYLVRDTLDRKYGHSGTPMTDPYTEDRNGYLYLVNSDGRSAVLCDGIVEVTEIDDSAPQKPSEPSERYSDEWLEWAARHSPSTGERRTAPMLREIPFQHRTRAACLAHAIMNRVATNYSGAMWDAIAELKRANYGETVTERQNREWREQEKARRDAKWEAEVRAFQRSQGVTA